MSTKSQSPKIFPWNGLHPSQGAPSSEFDRFCEDWQRCKGCVANDGCQDHDIYRTNSGKAHASHFPYKVKYYKIHVGDKC